jgi:SAM-dependent methyltransferase
LSEFEDTLGRIQDTVDQTIVNLETAYYQESEILYQQMMEYDSVDYILNRTMINTESVKSFITARIQLHSDWRHAGMIIRPGREDWINLLVGCDPLYLVDTDTELLQPAVLRHNDQYQRRLRTYIVNERDGDAILGDLPNQQFAFCLVYNFFNFKPINIIARYLAELYEKTKPGGTVAFTFYDGDRAGAVALSERHYSFYTPGRGIYQHIADIGFQITQKYEIDSACVWIELQKPGKLTSIKGGQALAEIRASTYQKN